jgi:hypothetical protein
MKNNIKDMVIMVIMFIIMVVVVNHAIEVDMFTVTIMAYVWVIITMGYAVGTLMGLYHKHMDHSGYGYRMHHVGCVYCDEMVRMYHLTTTTCDVCGMGAHPCHATVTMGGMVCEHCTYHGATTAQDSYYASHVEGCVVCDEYITLYPHMQRACSVCHRDTPPCDMHMRTTSAPECKRCYKVAYWGSEPTVMDTPAEGTTMDTTSMWGMYM